MKNILLLFMIVFLTSGICSCRTKKSTTDLKETKTETVSITDNSTVAKKETVTDNIISRMSSEWSDKSFFEAWMSFESDKITITDNQGNKTEITNPRINKKSSQKADVSKSDQTDSESDKIAEKEENQQNDVKTDSSKEIKTELKTTDERKTKIVWFYWIGGLVFVIFFVFLVIRYSKKSN